MIIILSIFDKFKWLLFLEDVASNPETDYSTELHNEIGKSQKGTISRQEEIKKESPHFWQSLSPILHAKTLYPDHNMAKSATFARSTDTCHARNIITMLTSTEVYTTLCWLNRRFSSCACRCMFYFIKKKGFARISW